MVDETQLDTSPVYRSAVVSLSKLNVASGTGSDNGSNLDGTADSETNG